MRSAQPFLLCVLVVCCVAASACQKAVDLKTVLKVTDITTGWYDAGLVEDQKNKLVPSISFRLTNNSDVNLKGIQINTVFRRVGEEDEWGSAYALPLRDGLAPGKESDPIVLRSPLGYTGLQARNQMLQNREFVDARVEVFGKYGSAGWVKLAESRIQRQLLTR